MTKVIKHALKYQEYRRTLFLNLMGKDDFGRHRGQVLYGMELTPSGTSVRVRPGAFITPYGTRFYWDVVSADDPSINTIDLATLQIDGQGILDTYNDIRRPIMVAIVARATPEEPARQPGVEAETDMGANSLEFAAFVVAHSRADSHPTLNLPPLNPVEMDEEQTGLATDYDYLKTWDIPSVNSTVALLAGNPATESLGVNDILLGYVIIGCTSGGTPVRTLQSGGTWASGVAYVPARNAWQAMTDFLGFDPLMGRVSSPITGPIVGSASPAAEGALVKFQAGGGAGLGTTTYLSPKFGTPAVFSDAAPWIGDWKDYRPPSFLKDGEQLIWQMRRLDVFLRLWMDRTGDQTLIQLIQDGGHADTSWQTPVHRLLQVFTGLNGVGTGNKNLNVLAWPDGAPGVSEAVANHVLKSGVAGHLDRGLAVLASEFGDTHASAVAALDWAVWHLLNDVFGFGLNGRSGVDRSFMRSTGAWTRSAIAGLAHTGDAPHAGRPVLVTGAATAYLDTEPVMDAVAAVAQRTSAGGTNLLRNPCFQAGDGNSQVDGEIPFWTRDGASTWSRGDLVAALLVKQLSLTFDGGNRQVYQRLDDAALASVLTVGEPLSVAATLQVTSGQIELVLRGQTSGGAATVFEAKSQPLTTMGGFQTHSFSFKPSSVTGVARLELIVKSADGSNASVTLAGLWAGPGMPPLNPALQSDFHSFISRDGGVIAALRGDLDLGNFKLKRVANGVASTDGINKGQLDGAISTEVSDRNGAISTAVGAEALARSNADSGLQNQINAKAPIDSPTFTGVPAAPTPTAGDSSTKLATTAFVGTALGSAAKPKMANIPAHWFIRGVNEDTGNFSRTVSLCVYSRALFNTPGAVCRVGFGPVHLPDHSYFYNTPGGFGPGREWVPHVNRYTVAVPDTTPVLTVNTEYLNAWYPAHIHWAVCGDQPGDAAMFAVQLGAIGFEIGANADTVTSCTLCLYIRGGVDYGAWQARILGTSFGGGALTHSQGSASAVLTANSGSLELCGYEEDGTARLSVAFRTVTEGGVTVGYLDFTQAYTGNDGEADYRGLLEYEVMAIPEVAVPFTTV